MSSKFNKRSYHLASNTLSSLTALPSWLKMRREKNSVGFQYMNALIGMEGERFDKVTRWTRNHMFLDTSWINEEDYLQRAEVDKIVPDLTTISAQAATDGNNVEGDITVTVKDTEKEFMYDPPTRVTYLESLPLAHEIVGLEYVVDHPLYPTGCYVATYDNPNPTGYNVLYLAENGVELRREVHGVEIQDYSHAGYDEILYPAGSGHQYSEYRDDPTSNPWGAGIYNKAQGEFEHQPIAGTVKMYDMLNLDPSGHATEIPAAGRTVYYDDTTRYMGYDPDLGHSHLTTSWSWSGSTWQFVNPISNYITTYKYRLSTNPKYLTTREKKNYHSVYSSKPTYTSQVPSYAGTEIPFEATYLGGAIRVDPLYLRPGNTAQVTVPYQVLATGQWLDSNSQYSQTLTDSHLQSVTADSVHIYYQGDDLWPRSKYSFDPEIQGGDTIVIPPTSTMYFGAQVSGPFDVRVLYDAQETFGATGVQSYSSFTNIHPYPYDYKIVSFGEGKNQADYLKPYTVLPLVHKNAYIQDVLASGDLSKCTVKTTKEYAGIAYSEELEALDPSPNRSTMWVFERMNQILEKRTARDNKVTGKWAMFCPYLPASGTTNMIMPTGMTLLKEETMVEQDGRRHTYHVYRDADGREVYKKGSAYFPLLAYDMHRKTSKTNDGSYYVDGQIYRDVRGLTEYACNLYFTSSTSETNLQWPPTTGEYLPVGPHQHTDGYVYGFDGDTLEDGPDAIPVKAESDYLKLGSGCLNPRDLTVNADEGFSVAHSPGPGTGTIRVYPLHYDHAYVEKHRAINRSSIYFRESYTSVTNV